MSMTPSRPPQIVVGLAHVGLVQEHLRGLRVGSEVADRDPDLGLALLDLDQAGVAAAARDRASGAAELDELLRLLYASFAPRYGRWVPTLGKNRVLEQVVASHTIGGGDEGDPVALHTIGGGDEGDPTALHTIGGGDEGIPEALGITWPARREEPGRGVRVAVADTAVASRPELVGNLLAGPGSLLQHDNALPAAAGHATFVSGLVLSAAPGAIVQVVRVLDDDGTSDSWNVARAIVQLSRTGVQVLNLSLGCFTDDDQPPLVLTTAMDRLGPDTLVVAAAGNHARTYAARPLWPAALDDVVAVGATGQDGTPAPWSPDPASNPWVDVLAWGDKVDSTYLAGPVQVSTGGTASGSENFSGFARWSGTSFAAARVSGMVAAGADRAHDSATALRDLVHGAPQVLARPWLR